ncbi:MAG: hypothetical protein AMJ78_01655 [Omnitrophica WOR_2 bacterium SM23_29]|nr:MAG: hypothetical protein AMJ78_01655 [Omnitrophica WOR_2 bacterium SM23_29]
MNPLFRVVIICLILFSVLSVYVTIPTEENFAKTADEGYYFIFASLVNEGGVSQFPFLAKTYIDNKEARLFPTPLRIGHILSTALWFKLFPNTLVSLAQFSLFCFILFLVVSFYFARRNFNRDVAYLFTLLLSSSPLMMVMGRRALSEMHGNLLWALVIWLFLDFLRKENKIKYFIFLLAYSYSITVRESSIALLLFFALFFFIHKYAYKKSISGAYLLGIAFVPLFLLSTAYVILFQGVGNVLRIVGATLNVHFGIQTSTYALLFCTGPWYRYIVDYLLLSPVTTLLFTGYFCYTTLIRNFEWKTTYFMIYFTLVFIIFSFFRYSKVVRFVINLDMVIALFSVKLLYELFRQKDEQRQTYFVFVTIVALFIINYLSFIDLFCIKGIYDPISHNLLSARKFIP